jgi:hypothetical protein
MPWELDYALLSFTQLQKSRHYIDKSDTIYIDVTLNLSSYIIDWSSSKISKDFFIKKYEDLKVLLDGYICKFDIYDDDKLYGGLDFMLESTEDHVDHYMILNPDMYFSERSIYYLIESSKLINNKYFVITQQIPKLWDETWDEISHPNYSNVEYKKWHEIGLDDVRWYNENLAEEPKLTTVNNFKWAGWMDLYNKNMWLDFWAYHKDWNGYGACDLYTIHLATWAKNNNVDFQQYLIQNQLVYPYWANKSLVDFTSYYKNMLSLNEIPNQREQFDSKMTEYLIKGKQNLIKKHS